VATGETGAVIPPDVKISVKPTGRPPKITEEAVKALLLAIRAGNYMHVAAKHAGIHRATFDQWLRKGANAAHGKYKTFHDLIQKALADAETRNVAVIAGAAKKSWQASAWLLERKYPKRWGRSIMEHQGSEDRPIKIELVTPGFSSTGSPEDSPTTSSPDSPDPMHGFES